MDTTGTYAYKWQILVHTVTGATDTIDYSRRILVITIIGYRYFWYQHVQVADIGIIGDISIIELTAIGGRYWYLRV